MGRKPTSWRVHPELVRHWMEDDALGHDWTPFREVMLLHSTLDADLFTLDVEHMDGDVMHYDTFMMIGACFPFGHHFNDQVGSFDD